MTDWSNVFAESLPYREFLDRHANQSQRERWDAMHARVALSPAQRGLLNTFTRRIPVISLTGAWCGDCINQCPIFDHISHASSVIDLRFLDRDALPVVREQLMINGGARVPVVVFLSEDWQEVSRYGERTLSIYRKLAADQLGPSCPTGLVPPTVEALATITSEWLAEFERAHLILRLSPRLRSKHGD
jgi:Thioredoxin